MDGTLELENDTKILLLGDPVIGEEERLQFHSVSCDDAQEVSVPEEVPSESSDIIIEEDPNETLAWLESDPLIASRYTEDDPDFAKEMAAEYPEIPIVTKWYGKPKATLDRRSQEMDRRRQWANTSDSDSPYHKRPRFENHYNKGYSDHRHGGHGYSSGPGHYGRGYGWRDDRHHDRCPPNDYRRHDRYQDRNDGRRQYDRYPPHRNDDRRHDRYQDRNDNRR